MLNKCRLEQVGMCSYGTLRRVKLGQSKTIGCVLIDRELSTSTSVIHLSSARDFISIHSK